MQLWRKLRQKLFEESWICGAVLSENSREAEPDDRRSRCAQAKVSTAVLEKNIIFFFRKFANRQN